MRSRLVFSIVVLVGLAGLAACGSTTSTSSDGGPKSVKTTPTDPLAGTSWKLASYQGPAGAAVPAAPKASAPLAFAADGIVGGSTGCNQFGGNYTVDGTKLSITLGPMTLMACTEPLVMAQETALVQLLPQVTGFDQSAEKLVLTGPDNAELLTYSAGLSSLEGTSWKATGVNNGTGGVETTALTENLTAMFGTAGAFTGFGGCNNLTGTYQTNGTRGLTITGLTSTKKVCTPDVDALESRYVAAIEQVNSYTISGDVLTVRNADGATQVIYRLAG